MFFVVSGVSRLLGRATHPPPTMTTTITTTSAETSADADCSCADGVK